MLEGRGVKHHIHALHDLNHGIPVTDVREPEAGSIVTLPGLVEKEEWTLRVVDPDDLGRPVFLILHQLADQGISNRTAGSGHQDSLAGDPVLEADII